MRIAVDLRGLGGGSGPVPYRLAEHVLAGVAAALERGGDDHVLLLCADARDRALPSPELEATGRVSTHTLPLSADPGPGAGAHRHPQDGQRLGAWLRDHRVDLHHSPLAGRSGLRPATVAGTCPVVAHAYEVPFSGVALAGADRWVVAAPVARRELAAELGVEPSRVSVWAPSAAPEFRRLSGAELAAGRERLTRRVLLPSQFVLAVAVDPAGDGLLGVFRAYAGLTRLAREATALVVALPAAAGEPAGIAAMAAEAGVTDDLVVIDPVADADLVVLQNLALAVAHCSVRDGLGAAVVEAMSCGTPVVAAGGCAADLAQGVALTAAEGDVGGISRGLDDLVRDPCLRSRLGELGISRAAELAARAGLSSPAIVTAS